MTHRTITLTDAQLSQLAVLEQQQALAKQAMASFCDGALLHHLTIEEMQAHTFQRTPDGFVLIPRAEQP